MEVDVAEVLKVIVDAYGPWGILCVGLWLLYRQNVALSDRLDAVTEKFIELSQQSIEINREHASAIDNLQDKIILYYVRRNIQNVDEG